MIELNTLNNFIPHDQQQVAAVIAASYMGALLDCLVVVCLLLIRIIRSYNFVTFNY